MHNMHELLGLIDFRILMARVAVGAVAAILSLLILLRPVPAKVTEMPRSTFDGCLVGIFALVRLLLFILVFVVAHQNVRGDLPVFYLRQAHKVLQGQVIYRDFYSSYGPLNALMNSLLLRIYDSGLSMVVFQVLCDIATVPVLLALFRRFLDETTVRRIGLLLLVQPMMLWNSTIDGRNEALTALLLATAMLLISRRDFWSGVSAGLTLVLVKFLPIMYFPSILLAARKRGLWVLGAALLPVPIFGYMLLRHYPAFEFLKVEGALSTAGSFSFALMAATGWMIPKILLDGLTALTLAIVLGGTGLATLRASSERARLWAMNIAVVALMLALLVISKKAYPAYLTAVAGPMAAYVAYIAGRRGRKIVARLYAVLMFFSVFASSLWYWPLGAWPAEKVHTLLQTGLAWFIVPFILTSLPAVFFLWLLIEMLRDVDKPPVEAIS